MDQLRELSIVKEFALKTLNCFDDLAKPEIKNRVMLKLWDYLKNYTFKIILRKPDAELKEKLKQVHETLGPLFADVQMSEEIKQGEKLGSPIIPDVGELAKVKSLTNSNKLLKELGL